MFESVIADLFGLVTTTGEPVPLVGVDVKADLVGRGAKVTLAQRFVNTEQRPLEAVYKFPLPQSGAVCGFRVRIGGRVIESEVAERDDAFRRYDEALSEGHGAYLLDEERPNVYTLSVGNLEPGMEAVTEVTYVGLLESDGPHVRFFLPTTISPRYVPAGESDAERRRTDQAVNPDFAFDVPYGLHLALDVHDADSVESVESASHHVVVDFGGSPVHVEFVSDSAKMDRDFVLDVTHKQGLEHRGYLCTRKDETFAQVDLCFPEPDEATPAQEREVVFVVDCSGSMSGTSTAQARQALAILLRSLPEGIRFNVVRFGGTFEPLFASAEAYTPESAGKALALVEAMDADLGGTEILRPLESVTERPPLSAARRDIILVTDGEVGNEDDVVRLAESKRERNRIFTVAIGYGPNEYFIRQVARTSGGTCVMATPGERIEPPVLRLFKRVMSASVTGLRIDWPGAAEQAPYAPVAHLGETTSVFGRMPGEVGIRDVGVSAGTAEKDVQLRVPLGEVAADGPLPQLWARDAIRDLEEGGDERSRRGSKQERGTRDVTARVVELSKRYGVISRSTSFLAIETREGEDRTREESVLRRVPVMLTKDWHGLGGFQGPAAAAPGVMGFAAGRLSLSRSLMVDGRVGAAPSSFAPSMRRGGRPRAAAGDDSQEANVLALLALQRPEGGFALSAEPAKLVEVPLDVMQGAAAEAAAAGAADAEALVATTVVLAALRTRFSTHAALWESLVRKSETWLAARLAASPVEVGGLPLEEWARWLLGG